jgi:hypothetical protein
MKNLGPYAINEIAAYNTYDDDEVREFKKEFDKLFPKEKFKISTNRFTTRAPYLQGKNFDIVVVSDGTHHVMKGADTSRPEYIHFKTKRDPSMKEVMSAFKKIMGKLK